MQGFQKKIIQSYSPALATCLQLQIAERLSSTPKELRRDVEDAKKLLLRRLEKRNIGEAWETALAARPPHYRELMAVQLLEIIAEKSGVASDQLCDIIASEIVREILQSSGDIPAQLMHLLEGLS